MTPEERQQALTLAQAKVARWERQTQRRQNEFNTAEARLNESKRWLRIAHAALDVAWLDIQAHGEYEPQL